MSAPYRPEPGRLTIPALSPWQQPDGSPPPGPFLPPRRPAVRVLFTDRSWRPAEVLRWYRGRHIMDDRPLWYVQLKLLVDGQGQVSVGWYAYDARSFEPR